jgi:6-phosphogluconolactonase
MTAATWDSLPDADALADTAAALILARAAGSVRERGCFSIVVPGGRSPVRCFERLRHAPVDFSDWIVMFSDERCLQPGDPERNDSVADRHWLGQVDLPADRVLRIPAELGPEAGASAYATRLARLRRPDLVLLGIGEDGHTASLFPGLPIGDSPEAPIALPVTGAPKPPPERVSLSARYLSRARSVLVLVDDPGKALAVARWRRGDDLPIAKIQPSGELRVLCTKEVAAD